MARKKANNEGSDVELSEEDNNKLLEKALSDLETINPDSAFLNENAMSNVTDWIDTGCYSLNAIISGSVFGGIPVGRVTGLVGPSATGKTLILNKIMANAIKKGYKPVYFDSENALDAITAKNLGCDITKIRHMPVEFIEDCKHQAVTLLTKLIDANLKKKVIIIIDSLGNLITRKELTDAQENSGASDMGSRAKHLGSLLKVLTTRASKAEVPVIFSNHIYENPGQMHPTLVKTQSGGLKPLYLSSALIQLSTSTEKIEKATSDKIESSKISEKVSGVWLTALTTKNRFVVPFLKTTMYLNYKTGLSPYIGLLDMAVAYGIITRDGARCSMGDEKLGYASTFEDDPKFWNIDMLTKLDEALKKDLAYSSTNDTVTTSV